MTHPAVPLILDAEATPVFRFAWARVDEKLATASQTEPESLGKKWVLRLAQRYADVLIQSEQVERAKQWLDIADKRLRSGPPHAPVDQAVLRARYALRRGDELGARRSLSDAERLMANVADVKARSQRRTRIDVAMAELHTTRAVFGPVAPLIEGHLRREHAFASVDDLWRAQRLGAFAAQVRLEFEGAVDLYQAVADLCASHDAPRDHAEALVGKGQCELGLGRYHPSLVTFRKAYALAGPESQTFKTATGALVAGLLSGGEVDEAIQIAQRSAVQAASVDDYRGYVECVGVVTNLFRIQHRYKEAYKALLAIYGTLQQNFGPEATTPITDLIALLQEDLGDERFEALAAEILAEVQGRT